MSTSLTAQQRPLLTEDPETIGEAVTLLEVGMSHVWDQPYSVSGLEGNRISAPLLGLSFGMGRNAEVQIDRISYDRLSITDRFEAPLSNLVNVPGDVTSGFDDVVVGTKVRFVAEGERMPALALRFATRLPNASNETGLGLDTMDFFQSLLVGKTMQSVRVVGNIGLAILSDPTHGDRQNDLLTYGVSVARALTQSVEVVGEINGRVSTRRGTPPPGTESRGGIVFGTRYTRGSIRLDAGFLTGLTPQDASIGVTGGLTWVFASPVNP
jgi:hypothetical protein